MIVLKIIGWVLLSILALVFAVILFVLFVHVGFDVEYSDEQTAVDLKWLFLQYRLYPFPKKAKKTQPEKKTAEAPAQPPEPAEDKPESGTDLTAAEPAASEPASDSAETSTEETPAEEAPAAESGTETKTGSAPAAKKKDSLLKTIYDAEGVDGLITIVKKVFSYTKTFFGNCLHGVVVDRLWLEVRCTRSDAASTALYYGEVCGILFPMLGSLASRCRIKEYDINVFPDYIARFSEASFFVSFHFTPAYFLGITIAYGMKMLFGIFVGMLVKIFLPKKEKKQQEVQIKSTEKSERK